MSARPTVKSDQLLPKSLTTLIFDEPCHLTFRLRSLNHKGDICAANLNKPYVYLKNQSEVNGGEVIEIAYRLSSKAQILDPVYLSPTTAAQGVCEYTPILLIPGNPGLSAHHVREFTRMLFVPSHQETRMRIYNPKLEKWNDSRSLDLDDRQRFTDHLNVMGGRIYPVNLTEVYLYAEPSTAINPTFVLNKKRPVST
jgi:hypothetical protein